jgi:hypothetical protein
VCKLTTMDVSVDDQLRNTHIFYGVVLSKAAIDVQLSLVMASHQKTTRYAYVIQYIDK